MRIVVKHGLCSRVLTRFNGRVIVVCRFRGGDDLRPRLEEALALLAAQRGYAGGVVGRNVDDPTLWVLQTRWDGAGAYRRALSAYDVRVQAWPVLAEALEEPNAYEVAEPGRPLNDARPRGVG